MRGLGEIINGTRQRSGLVQKNWSIFSVAMPGYGTWMQALQLHYTTPNQAAFAQGHDRFCGVQEIDNQGVYWYSQYTIEARTGLAPLDPISGFTAPDYNWLEIHRKNL